MLITTALLSFALLTTTSAQKTFQTSSKRGLVFVNNPQHPEDNQIWPPPKTDLTWYYNYQVTQSPVYASVSQSDFHFVPMLWNPTTTFKDQVQTQLRNGINITHVMGYNEPDGDHATGGSSVAASVAAANWIDQVEPLRKLGIKTGAPAVTGSPRGHTWLQDFFSNCTSLGTNCTIDFIPIHWYGNFEGLASHMGQVSATYPNISMWVTEYALPDASLNQSQEFFRTSAEYFDRLDFVERYSYFGSFRSDISNVGANAAMLDKKGQLTDIGAWYLGRAATGNIPSPAGKNAFQYSLAAAAMMTALWTLL